MRKTHWSEEGHGLDWKHTVMRMPQKRNNQRHRKSKCRNYIRRTGTMSQSQNSMDSEMRGSVVGTENTVLISVQPTSILSSLNSRQSQTAPTGKASTSRFQKACLNTSIGMQTVAPPSTTHPTKHSISWRNGQDFHSSSASMIQTSGALMSIHLERRPSIMWKDHKDFPSRISSGFFTRSECVRQRNPLLGN